jgi:hypothetical protein
LDEGVLLGASGTIGTIQRCRDEINKFAKELSGKGLNYTIEEKKPDGKIEYIKVRDKIREIIFLINKNELERHKAFYGTKKQAPLADILMVIYNFEEKNIRIWHVAPDGSEEFLDELGYGCTGIGDIFAYPFLKNLFSEELDIEKGKLVAYRVIKEAIEIGAFGLGEPIDIWVMNKNDGKIKQLTIEEIMALTDSYLTWRDMEREVFKKIYE